MGKFFLSVVIPCYNEEANLKRGVLKEVADYLKQQSYSWEVLVSDDGSTDRSLALISAFVKKNPGFRVLKNKHGGKPWAVSRGIKEARGQLTLLTDMDQSTSIDQLEKLLPWVSRDYPVVIGSRGMERKGFPFFRKVGAMVFRQFRGFFILKEISDTQCGFKLFRSDLLKETFPQLDALGRIASGWTVTSFDVELLFMLQKRGARIKEVLVSWQDRDASVTKGKAGKSSNLRSYLARYFKESRDMARQVLKVILNNWRGKYDRQPSDIKI
ncbi:MAG: glycosyltransferase [Candidatus Pacebacteria bacterium]|nr:glycosyltransferase [Candidatus Paceibacterota bacterium]